MTLNIKGPSTTTSLIVTKTGMPRLLEKDLARNFIRVENAQSCYTILSGGEDMGYHNS